MIKAIIFDFGNVISAFDNEIFLKEISKFSNKSVEELNELIYLSSDITKKYERGNISSDEFFREVSKKGNLSIEKNEFIQAYTGIFRPIEKTHALMKKLKQKYRIALLSNTSEWDFEHGIKQSGIFHLFDEITVSFRVGAMKPDKRMFLDAIEKLKLKPEECIYIDDIKEYADAAEEVGIHSIHYNSHEGLLDFLKEMGVDL
ncbi:MAG: hypothetical protein DRN66_01580 [Candidatus Nanohalarchaeota archaeon]|nr:MAG: hypothetical protein DRN66_01580 [Candidatus Nanohaloarchaeota archaeon]